jgi:hypothetical protein
VASKTGKHRGKRVLLESSPSQSQWETREYKIG